MNHTYHHSANTYGTEKDGEYVQLGKTDGWKAVVSLLQIPLVLILTPYRFLILVPATLLIPGGRRWLLKNASAFTMIPFFRYEKLPAAEPWWLWADLAASAWMWMVTLLFWTHTIPTAMALKFQALVLLGIGLNGFRNLIAHGYRSEGKPVSHLAQFEDSITIQAPWLVEKLFFPVGLKYHGLHHLFPTLPYHQMAGAHKLLLKKLPPDSPYHRNAFRPLGQAFQELFFPRSVKSVLPVTSKTSFFQKAALMFLAGFLLTILTVQKGFGDSLETQPVNTTFEAQGGSYHFVGDFDTDASPDVIWAVLTDYGHMDRFVANFHGKVRQRTGNKVLVEQTLGDGILFIRFEVHALLDVQEIPGKSIAIQDISHKDFGLFQNVWILQPELFGNQTKVIYVMDAQRNSHTPGFITADVFRVGLKNFLKQYRREIERRENQRALLTLKKPLSVQQD